MAKLIKVTKNFTIMSNSTLQTVLLSTKAKGMLATLLSLPDDWDFSVSGLSKHFCKEGKDAVREMLKELEQHSFLVRKQQKSKNGRFGKSVYFIGDVPLTDEDISMLMKKHGYLSEDFVEDNRSLPLSDYPSADSQSSETPTQTNKIITKKKKQIYSSIPQSTRNCNLTQETENDLQIRDNVTDMTEQEINNIFSEPIPETTTECNAEQCDAPVEEDHSAETPVHFDSEEFKKQICFDKLNRDKPTYSAQFRALVNVIGNVLSSKDKLRVSGQFISPQLASKRFSKLRYDHVLHVLETYNQRLRDEKKPNDPRAYLLSMLYNSVSEQENDFILAFGSAAPEKEYSFSIEDYMSLVNRFDDIEPEPETKHSHDDYSTPYDNGSADFYMSAFAENVNRF